MATIRAMESILPAAGFIAGMLAFLPFALSREAHAQLRAELDARGTSLG